MERDMVFVPETRAKYTSRIAVLAHELSELVEEAPIFTTIEIIGRQLIGWWWYLTANVTGHDNHERQSEGKGKGKRNSFLTGVNHFLPSSPLFDRKDEHLVLLSDLGLILTLFALFSIGKAFGWKNLFI
jgi:omega-6 fatty acid desaturase / acyl-lipid omega-6 desaturase (Delta-12 desaturase)